MTAVPVRAADDWTLVLPVQRADVAKSRLQAPAGVRRADLAHAIALDSLDAVREARRVRRVIVVTADPRTARYCRAVGVQLVTDPGGGLNAAVTAGVRLAHDRGDDGPTAVLLPDVPAARSQDLDDVLAAASSYPFSLLADEEGTGSVLLAAVPGGGLRPSFGVGSAERHRHLGAVPLAVDVPRLRRDVDTVAALGAAAALGVGRRTTGLLRRAAGPGA